VPRGARRARNGFYGGCFGRRELAPPAIAQQDGRLVPAARQRSTFRWTTTFLQCVFQDLHFVGFLVIVFGATELISPCPAVATSW